MSEAAVFDTNKTGQSPWAAQLAENFEEQIRSVRLTAVSLALQLPVATKSEDELIKTAKRIERYLSTGE